LHDSKLSVSGDLKTGTLQSYNSALKTPKYKSVLKEYAPLFIMMAFALVSFIGLIQIDMRIGRLEIESQKL